jgi:hypothetical protein
MIRRMITMAMVSTVLAAGSAGAQEVVVYPRGDAAVDAFAVFDALNQVPSGGTVRLKAVRLDDGAPQAFDFAGYSVPIPKSVRIEGEVHAEARTRILGGFPTFRCQVPASVAIAGIVFEKPGYAAILIQQSTGLEITENEILDVSTTSMTSQAFGVMVDGFGAPAPVLSGTWIIRDNRIDNVGPTSPQSFGIVVSARTFPASAEVSIRGNSVTRIVTDGILVTQITTPVSIEDNYVAPGPGNGAPMSLGDGIGLANRSGGPFQVRNNHLVIDNPRGHGILADQCPFSKCPDTVPPMLGSILSGNTIELRGAASGITLGPRVSQSVVQHNRISGTAHWALGIVSWANRDASPARDTIFHANHLAHFSPQLAHVALSSISERTVLVGFSGTVVDAGIGSVVTGFTRGQALGPEISAALGERPVDEGIGPEKKE